MWHFLLQGGVVTHTSSSKCDQRQASTASGKEAPSAETFFLVKMRPVPGLMSSEAKYRGMTVNVLHCLNQLAPSFSERD